MIIFIYFIIVCEISIVKRDSKGPKVSATCKHATTLDLRKQIAEKPLMKLLSARVQSSTQTKVWSTNSNTH